MVAVIVFVLVIAYLIGKKVEHRDDIKTLSENLLKNKGRKK